jgi:DNA-damage-inducible protein D
VQSIETRKRLTDEWKNRGVQDGQEYSILTSTISKGTFGLSPSEHSDIKGLNKENLRDHMTPMELILTAFSEEATRQIAMRDDAQGFNENHEAAQLGGKIGGEARQNFEKNTGLKVVSKDNFQHLKEGKTDKLIEGNDKTT